MTLPESIPGDTTVTSFLPIAGYMSDTGLLGGVVLNRIQYHPVVKPYVSLTEGRVLVSTKGLFDFQLRFEQMETFGLPVRSRWTLYGERDPTDLYFGTGNDATFDDDLWSEGFYDFLAVRAGFKWTGRNMIFQPAWSGGQLDLVSTIGFHYETADEDSTRLMGQMEPLGMHGGYMTTIGTGLMWENRDNEIDPSQGNMVEITGNWSPAGYLGDFPMASFTADVRQYYPLPLPVLRPVLAFRAKGNWVTGTVPYWELPHLGDEYTLRGYPVHRFRGTASLLYNAELRTWVYEYPELAFKLGFQLFSDGGRVFNSGDDWSDLFQDYHRTYGVGFATSLFSPDFIFRLDVGFSDEMYRLYANVGYMF